MKTQDIRATTDKHLSDLGIAASARWLPGMLLVHIGGGFREFKFRSGMSQKALMFELGRISAFVELANQLKPSPMPTILAAPTKRRSKANGKAHVQPEIAIANVAAA